MGIFSRAKKGERVVALFDVSSGSVGGAHAMLHRGFDKAKKPSILAAHRVNLQFKEDLNIKRFITETVVALERVAAELGKADTHRPDYVQFVLSSPWYVSQTRTIVQRKDAPFVFTERLLNEMIEREISHIIEHELEKFGPFGKDGKIIERQISQVRLNGYASSNPFGKQATEVELTVTVTFAPNLILTRLRDAVGKHYHIESFGFTTAAYTAFVAFRDFIEPLKELTIIDVGEEVTDVAFIKNGVFLYQHSFPIGTYGLIRTLMADGTKTLAEAESLLAAFRNKHLTATAKNRINIALQTFIASWQIGLQGVVQTGHFGFALPEDMLIVTDPRYEIIFQNSIEQDPVLGYLMPAITPKVRFFDEQLVESLGQNFGSDVPLVIGSLFLERQW